MGSLLRDEGLKFKHAWKKEDRDALLRLTHPDTELNALLRELENYLELYRRKVLPSFLRSPSDRSLKNVLHLLDDLRRITKRL